ncbi:hypothetical protein [Rhizobium sp. Leaf371]|uniref:hypothetical protein n=1 Tax=Rhizobium sp. Leaf371 TaxID=1736355 RepID=UPI000B0AF04B|nr:hypothetical protein [Rhizobium sp. Leaf371]
MQELEPHRPTSPTSLNYRIDVFHRGRYLATSVMEASDLRLLLDVSGHLHVATFEAWVEMIVIDADQPQFTLDAKGTVTYRVTPVAERATHDGRSIH